MPCSPGQPQTHYIAKNDLECLILHALSPKCREYRTAPRSVYTALCIKAKSSYMLGKHSSSSAPVLPHNRSITVLLGAHNKKVKEDTWQRLEVENQFPHPEYDDHLNLNDIMLLKVTSFSFDSTPLDYFSGPYCPELPLLCLRTELPSYPLPLFLGILPFPSLIACSYLLVHSPH